MENYNMNDFRALEQTTFLMLSDDYKDRFIAEYYQLKTRKENLEKIITKYEANTLNFEPKCSIDLLKRQFEIMTEYMHVLNVRAEIENITL